MQVDRVWWEGRGSASVRDDANATVRDSTSVTRVAREMCALDGGLQTSGKESRTRCCTARWRTVGRNTGASKEKVGDARSDGRRVAAGREGRALRQTRKGRAERDEASEVVDGPAVPGRVRACCCRGGWAGVGVRRAVEAGWLRREVERCNSDGADRAARQV